MSQTVLPLTPLRRRWSHGLRPAGSGPGLTGRQVLGTFLAFFGAIFLMNGVLIYWAVRTNAGIVANEPYRKGLNYNERIAAEERQAALGWTEALAVTPDGAVSLALSNKAGQPVTGLTVEATLGRPATSHDDARLVLREVTPGRYQAQAAPLAPGSWLVALEVRNAAATAHESVTDPVYRIRRRLWLTP